MGKSITDLAVETFTGKATDNPEQDRFKKLSAMERSGKALSDDERKELAMHRKSIHSGKPAASVDDIALGEFSKRKPLDLEIGPIQVQQKPVRDVAVGPITQSPVRDVQVGGIKRADNEQYYDPETPAGSVLRTTGAMMTSPDPRLRAVGHAYYQRMQDQTQMIPNAKASLIAPDRKGQLVIPANEIGGIRENGTEFGRYDEGPTGDWRNNDVRFADRKRSDVHAEDKDKFGDDTLQDVYGKHLKEVDDNNGKYPAGYFKGMSPEKKEDIKKGVQELLRRRRGIRT